MEDEQGRALATLRLREVAWAPTLDRDTLQPPFIGEVQVNPSDGLVRRTITLVHAKSNSDYDVSQYFDGEVEACINGLALSIGRRLAEDKRNITDRWLSEQLENGGWN